MIVITLGGELRRTHAYIAATGSGWLAYKLCPSIFAEEAVSQRQRLHNRIYDTISALRSTLSPMLFFGPHALCSARRTRVHTDPNIGDRFRAADTAVHCSSEQQRFPRIRHPKQGRKSTARPFRSSSSLLLLHTAALPTVPPLVLKRKSSRHHVLPIHYYLSQTPAVQLRQRWCKHLFGFIWPIRRPSMARRVHRALPSQDFFRES